VFLLRRRAFGRPTAVKELLKLLPAGEQELRCQSCVVLAEIIWTPPQLRICILGRRSCLLLHPASSIYALEKEFNELLRSEVGHDTSGRVPENRREADLLDLLEELSCKDLMVYLLHESLNTGSVELRGFRRLTYFEIGSLVSVFSNSFVLTLLYCHKSRATGGGRMSGCSIMDWNWGEVSGSMFPVLYIRPKNLSVGNRRWWCATLHGVGDGRVGAKLVYPRQAKGNIDPVCPSCPPNFREAHSDSSGHISSNVKRDYGRKYGRQEWLANCISGYSSLAITSSTGLLVWKKDCAECQRLPLRTETIEYRHNTIAKLDDPTPFTNNKIWDDVKRTVYCVHSQAKALLGATYCMHQVCFRSFPRGTH